ncbi:MAG: ester cyclase [Solirubrobacteraceae bacterium]
MSSQDLQARAEALFAAWNRRDYDEVAKFLSPDVVLVDHIRSTTMNGPDGYIDRFKPMMDAFPDMAGEATSLSVNGNVIAQETVWRGTHTSPLVLPSSREIDPTYQQVTVHIAVFLEFNQEGSVTAIRTYGNPTESMLDLRATSSLAGGTG